MKNDVTGIICAMSKEADELIKRTTDTSEHKILGRNYIKGKLCGENVVISVSGIGKVAAAACAQTMMLMFSPTRIINTGVAGGLADGLSVNDIVVATDVVQHDLDTTEFGDPPGYVSELGIVNIPCDPEMTEALGMCAEALGIKHMTGTIASGDQFISSNKKKTEIVKKFGAAACEMEGAAIGRVCFEAGVRFAVVRSISDGGDAVEYEQFVHEAIKRSAMVIFEYLNSIG